MRERQELDHVIQLLAGVGQSLHAISQYLDIPNEDDEDQEPTGVPGFMDDD
ncbi:MAG: hypothetical protein OXC31_24955 [Spirochaetaceae bacterium]|nr:hypothetical protein [Spirochaetaceae bacterium]